MKKCPFCKKNALLLEHDWGDCHPITNYGVGCSNPKCWAAVDQDICWHSTKEEAILLWETRT